MDAAAAVAREEGEGANEDGGCTPSLMHSTAPCICSSLSVAGETSSANVRSASTTTLAYSQGTPARHPAASDHAKSRRIG